jgi:hypothetical protein
MISIEEAAHQLSSQRNEIIEAFFKAYVCSVSLCSVHEMADIIKNIDINIQLKRGDIMSWKVSARLKEENFIPKISDSSEIPCNFCGTPSSNFPSQKCARTPICTNFKEK